MVILIVRFKARLTRGSTLTYPNREHLLERTYGALRGCYILVSNLNINRLIKKLTIVSDGALKRGNKEIFKRYNHKLQDWSIELDKLKK